MTWLGWTGKGNRYWLALAALGDEDDIEDRIERAWLYRVSEPRHRRLKFAPPLLARYELTQPRDICQRCLRWTGNEDYSWELDHIVELQYGGLDHPINLVRLCIVCHRTKPLPPESMWDDPEAMRDLIIAWIRHGPAGGAMAPTRSALSAREIAELDAEMAEWRREHAADLS